jgi:hypothetical protein
MLSRMRREIGLQREQTRAQRAEAEPAQVQRRERAQLGAAVAAGALQHEAGAHERDQQGRLHHAAAPREVARALPPLGQRRHPGAPRRADGQRARVVTALRHEQRRDLAHAVLGDERQAERAARLQRRAGDDQALARAEDRGERPGQELRRRAEQHRQRQHERERRVAVPELDRHRREVALADADHQRVHAAVDGGDAQRAFGAGVGGEGRGLERERSRERHGVLRCASQRTARARASSAP